MTFLPHTDKKTFTSPLSFSQQRLWFLDQYIGNKQVYNISRAFRFEGHLNLDLLDKSIQSIIKRHEILRTTFQIKDGDPVQVISKLGNVDLIVRDFNKGKSTDEQIQNFILSSSEIIFNLETGPLIRFELLGINDTSNVLVVVMHHIISDGWSLGILMQELIVFYKSYLLGEESGLPDLPIQFADYSEWQLENLQGEKLERLLNYWKKQLADIPPVISLPTDRPRSKAQSYQGNEKSFIINQELASNLKRLSQDSGVTLNMGLLSAYATFLYRYSGDEKIVIGSPVANRNRKETESLIGFFVNTLAFKTDFSSDISFNDLLHEVKKTIVDGLEHQELPFEKLVEILQPERNASHAPLFQVAFIFQNSTDERIDLTGLNIETLPIPTNVSKFDLSLYVEEANGILKCHWEYATDLFDEDTIVRMSNNFLVLLESIVSDPSKQVGEFNLVAENELQQILFEFNNTYKDFPREKNLVDLFEEQVKKIPDNIAVTFENRSITYKQLNEQSNQLARYLVDRGVKPGENIGLLVTRSFSMIIGMYGILKTGGAYVPVDPEYPFENQKYILTNSLVKKVVTDLSNTITDKFTGIDFIFLSNNKSYKEDFQNLNININSRQLAYTIYTSGSTGRPKGVMIEHYSVVNLNDWVNTEFKIGPGDRLLFITSMCFDLSVYDIFGILSCGATVVMANQLQVQDTVELKKLLLEQRITFWDSVPTTMNYLVEELEINNKDFLQNDLRIVFMSGDWIPVNLPDRIRKFFPNTRVISLGGATEGTVWSNYFPVEEVNKSWSSIPYGKPINNNLFYILNNKLKPVPKGVTGELYIGGVGVARGYANDNTLTSYSFKEDPFQNNIGGRMFKTGDSGRLLRSGNMEFLGRKDHQVKIRGYRIELEEIESVLCKYDLIEAAVVSVKKTLRGDKELVAYLVSKSQLNTNDIRNNLKKELPAYMIPGYYIQLESLPLTANGKIDKKSLPDPEGIEMISGVEYVAPSNETEIKLTEIWSDLLNIDKNKISIKDNFFESGGHSLKATRLMSRIYQELKVKLDLKDLFTSTVLEEQAALISRSIKTSYDKINKVPEQEYYPLSFAQNRLWILSQIEDDSIAYNQPLGFRITGQFDVGVLKKAVDVLIQRHESLRTVFHTIEGEPKQKILNDPGNYFEILDLSNLKQNEQLIKAENLFKIFAETIFNLENGPLIKLKILILSNKEFLLLWNDHHIINDGWSQGIMAAEVTEIYNALLINKPIELKSSLLTYKDYSKWHSDLFNKGGFDWQEDYWLTKFKDKPNGINLPTDNHRNIIQTFNGSALNILIKKEDLSRLKLFCNKSQVTVNMYLLSAIGILLYRYSGQKDIIIGSPIAGRKDPDLENLVGFLVNTIVFRYEINPESDFNDLVQLVKGETLNSYHHQDYPFDLLIDKLSIKRDLSQAPLFNVMMAYNNTEKGKKSLQLNNASILPLPFKEEVNMSKFDLIFFIDDIDENRLSIRLEYNSDLFNRRTAERMIHNLSNLIKFLVSNPSGRLKEADLLEADEKDLLINKFNDTSQKFEEKTVQVFFEQQVDLTPNQDAIIFNDEKITYRQVNERANRLANFLRKTYLHNTNTPIALSMDRSIDMIVCIIGIIKSGAAYIAIDPSYPKERISHMLKDSRCTLIISDEISEAKIAGFNGDIINYKKVQDTINKYPSENPEIINTLNDPLYIIYTSGSTGMPNGAILSQGILSNLIQWHKYKSTIDGSLRCLQFTSINFCVSFQEIMTTLCSGGELYLIGELERQDVQYLSEFLENNKIQNLFLPFSYLNFLFSEFNGFGNKFKSSLVNIITAGEQLKITKGLKEFLKNEPEIKLHNHYGSSEMHVVSSYVLERKNLSDELPPVGTPISNTKIFILDEFDNPAPMGSWGEICVAGSHKILGYINNEKLTNEKLFYPSFLKDEKRIYRSGDIGRWNGNGKLELKGRKDSQVKIRGFRVEPGEIENRILSLQEVKDCIVIAKKDTNNLVYLVGYLVLGNTTIDNVQDSLNNSLPQFMIPQLVELKTLPLLPNGKVDREKLPIPDFESRKTKYIPAKTTTEAKLIEIWKKLLTIERIGIKDNFFEIGGDSLKAIRSISMIFSELHVKLSLLNIFKTPTIERLALLIDTNNKTDFISIVPAAIKENYPLSPAQRRLWVLSQFSEGNVAYNMPGIFLFEGNFNRKAFEYSFYNLVERHEILRTVFSVNEQSEVRQIIKSPDDNSFKITYTDLHNESNKNQLFKVIAEKEIIKPFDLKKGPLLRASLYQLEENKWGFICTMHHIISDGWSMGVMIKELSTLYNSFILSERNPLSPLKIQYKDFTEWQLTQLKNETFHNHRNYWLEQFEGEIPVLELTTDKVRPSVKTYNGGFVTCLLDKESADALKLLSLNLGGTLFMGLLAGVYTLLYRYTNQEDIIVGSPIAGREHTDLEGQIGFYVNTLALRTRFNGTDSFRKLFDKIKQVTLGAYEHQIYPFDELVDDLQLQRDMSHSALFDVMVAFQNTDINNSKSGEFLFKELNVNAYNEGINLISKFDLTFNFKELESGIKADIEYNSDLFNKDSIERMGSHLVQLFKLFAINSEKSINKVDYLSKEEKHWLLTDLNGLLTEFPRDKTVIDLFEEQVNKSPANIALVFEGNEISYSELNNISNQLGNYLRGKYKIKPDDLIGIKLSKSEWMIISIIGTLKSGGAYVPIDPAYPQSRIDFIVNDSKCKLVIDEKELEYFIRNKNNYSSDNLKSINKQGNIAYIIYTSGTTGNPKGTLIEHANLVSLFKPDKSLFDFHANDVWTLFHSISFDFSVWEMYGALLFGGKLIIIPSNASIDPQSFLELLIKNKVTILNQTPLAFYNLMNLELNRSAAELQLRFVIFGGDALTPGKLKEWKVKYPHTRLINMYGITETTVHVTFKEITQTEIENNTSNIGKHLLTLSCYVLDQNQNLLPAGVPGELYIGGHGVARGYLYRDDLTTQRFITNPYKKGERLYRSGDKVKLLNNGEMEYLGRVDDQVKILGYRIELSEIENEIKNIPEIDSVKVIVCTNLNQEKELVAYLTSAISLTISNIHDYLNKRLPAYMMPSHFVQLDKFPLTSNGKINLKALPTLKESGMPTGSEFIAPGNDIENKLADIWSEILNTEKSSISANDNFFTLGGQSLKAMYLQLKINKCFEVRLELKHLFLNPVLKEQAFLIDKTKKSAYSKIVKIDEQNYYPLSPAQRRLWILCQFEEGNSAYNIPDVYVLQGKLNQSALTLAFDSMIERHESLRTVFKEIEPGEIRQFILTKEEYGFAINYSDLRNEKNKEKKLKELIQSNFIAPFEFSRGPLLRVCLFQVSDDKWVLTYVMHHIISDGWSLGILINELLMFYNSYNNSIYNPLPPLEIQYKDYAAWQHKQLSGEILNTHKEYWLKQFEGEIPALELPSDKIRPSLKTFNGGIVKKEITREITNKIKTFCSKSGSTLFMNLLSAVNILLYKYSDQEDIIIGSPIAARQHLDLENQIGIYANTLALRVNFKGEDTFIELINNVKIVALGAYEHQIYPFDELVDALQLQRDISRNPLFDVQVILQNKENTNQKQKNPDDIIVSRYEDAEILTSRFDLIFNFIEREEDLTLNIEYNSDIYNADTALRFGNHLEQLLKAVLENPQRPIKEIDFLSDSEINKLLNDSNDTLVEYLREKTLMDLFEEQVVKTPENIALVFEGKNITYKELNEKSNQLAGHLRKTFNIKEDDLVGIMLDKSDTMIISILGVLKSGGAYIPIDPDYPQSRKEYIIKDTGLKLLITQSDYIFSLDYYTGNVFAIDVQLDLIDPSTKAPVLLNHADNLVYIIYTSGSTGQPKGSMLLQHAFTNLVLWYNEYLNLKEEDCVILMAPVSFDLAQKNIFAPLIRGARLLLPDKINRDYNTLSDTISKNKVTILNSAPSAFYPLLDPNANENYKKLSTLRKIILGGEPISKKEFQPWVKSGWFNGEVINSYGPTECTDVVSYFIISNDEWDSPKSIPIGLPINNAQLHVFNNNLNLVPAGMEGEIFISGVCVGRGYLNQPELTAEKFINNPYRQCDIMYRTGDLGKRLQDGNIEFTGRKDDQVKIRGFRIELEEIVRAMQSHLAIDTVIAMVRISNSNEKELTAYFVAKENLHTSDLRLFLDKLLPSYMIPKYFVQLEKFPLSPNGKIDKKALPDPDGSGSTTGEKYEAPRNELENEVVKIWKEILNRGKIGIRDGFFELGGDSIKILQMMAVMKKKLNLQFSIADVYKNNTIESILAHISKNRNIIELQNEKIKEQEFIVVQEIKELKDRVLSKIKNPIPESIEDIYPMSDIEKGMVFESLMNKELSIYHDQMVYHRLFIDFEINRFRTALELLAEKHPILRTSFNLFDFESPLQIVNKNINVSLQYSDISNYDREIQIKTIHDFLKSELGNAFNISIAPLWKMSIYNLGKNEYVFIFQCHHAIIDGWSDALFITELNNLYIQLKKDPVFVPKKLKSSYKDFIVRHEIDKKNNSAKQYWKNELVEYTRLDLFAPEDEVKTYTHFLEENYLKKLDSLSRKLNTTIKTISLCAYLYMMKLLNFDYEILTGLVTNTRPMSDDGDKILGCFLNTIPLKIRIEKNRIFPDLLKKIDDKLIELKKFERLSLMDISKIHNESKYSVNPFFDVLFNFTDFHAFLSAENDIPDYQKENHLKPLNINGNLRTNTFLDFTISTTGGNYYVNINQSKKLKSGISIEKLADLYYNILKYIIDNPDNTIEQLDYLNPEERNLLLNKFNETKTKYPKEKTITSLFEEQVNKTPGKIALVFEGTSLTYQELNIVSNQLSEFLSANYKISADDLIAIKLDRSEWMIISILGILKSGGAYVPIDPAYPQDRIDFMIQDSNCKFLIDETVIDMFIKTKNNYSTNNSPLVNTPDDLVYVMYTSGSTGNPKGVMVSNKNIVRLVKNTNYVDFTGKEILLSTGALNFDATTFEFWGMLLNGGKLVLCSQAVLTDPIQLIKAIENNNVNIMWFTSGWLNQLVESHIELFSKLNVLVAGGDKLSPSHISKLSKSYTRLKIINGYGPTENTTFSTYHELKDVNESSETIPIGKGISNSECYVLDDSGTLVPIGVNGEICVGGDGLARGYLNNPELTKEKFVLNPFKKSERIYKTGDIGHWLPDGAIRLIGRKDGQVKVRGYRVELGEVETIIRNLKLADDVVVLAKELTGGEKTLIAYLVSKNNLNSSDIRYQLSNKLPAYMIPSYFIQLDVFPLTPNGKIDRNSLPDPYEIEILSTTEYAPPENEIEIKLIDIWSNLLNIEKSRLGINDNFFESGGNSLIAIRLVMHIKKDFNVETDLKSIFMEPTIKIMAEKINNDLWLKSSTDNKEDNYDKIRI